MVEPVVVPRAEHPISRRDIDPNALKVLYRLRQFDYTAYLVGGSVRDLLIGRRPKDFDIGTSAHPYQVKRLFRNCWIIGRRFRLAHVKFGDKTVEVATFRRQVPAGEENRPGEGPTGALRPEPFDSSDRLIHRDNTFGTPEEDAFRRDFTLNALFYDIATFSIIDYVGGIEDIGARVIRCIGNPEERFREDPVRMLRAIALAARLDFAIDQPILAAIRRHKTEIARSAAPRLLEEYYKILRAGASEQAFRGLADLGLLEPVTPELQHGASDALWRSLAALDAYRRRFESTPDTLTNPVLLGSLLVPLGLASHARLLRPGQGDPRRDAAAALGTLQLARRDIERLLQMIVLQGRLTDPNLSARARRALMHRTAFADALTWLEIHHRAPDVADQWRQVKEEIGAVESVDPFEGGQTPRPPRRRRRGRRRFPRPAQ